MMERVAFNNEESVIINGICDGESMDTLTKAYVVGNLQAAKSFIATGDKEGPFAASEMIDASMIDDLLRKFEDIDEDEWDDMKLLLPFHVVWAPEDEDFDLDEDGAE